MYTQPHTNAQHSHAYTHYTHAICHILRPNRHSHIHLCAVHTIGTHKHRYSSKPEHIYTHILTYVHTHVHTSHSHISHSHTPRILQVTLHSGHKPRCMVCAQRLAFSFSSQSPPRDRGDKLPSVPVIWSLIWSSGGHQAQILP